jgi:hypothetical protein
VAKKPKTPAPPRPVQAPKRRDGSRGRAGASAGARRPPWFLYALAAAGPIALAIVLAVILLGRGGGDTTVSANVARELAAAGCKQKKYPILEGTHVTSLGARVKWDSFPPTSGPHYYAPAPWNFYDQQINPRITLHNLEHGGIDIFYGSKVPTSAVDQLRTFWQDSPNAMLVAPMPKPDKNTIVPRPVPDYSNKIVLTAWTAKQYTTANRSATAGNGYLATCGHFDEKAFAAFRDAHRGKGPERFPVSSLTPNT